MQSSLVCGRIARHFNYEGRFIKAHTCGDGHINDTFMVYIDNNDKIERYILQRVNRNVFKEPVKLMENVENVTRYLNKVITENGGDPRRETLSFITADNGKFYYIDSDGYLWRSYYYIHNASSYEMVEKPEQFYAAARAFGKFQRMLSDYPANTLHEIIKDFHNTRVRFDNFLKAVDDDVYNRAADVKREIDFVLKHEADTSVLVDLLKAGELPLRVTHNDTKLNNVLIDDETSDGLCVIDLDTVMPGLSLYDFGDSIRYGASTGAEDEKTLSKVGLDLNLFEQYSKGYIETAGSILTPKEIEYMPFSAKILTLECGIRFLTDYLNGDTYFKITRPEHNLDRCRTQFKLVTDMEKNLDAMGNIISSIINNLE